MRKIMISFIAIFMMAFFSACGEDQSPQQAENGSVQIVTTIFPEYDWVQNILGDNPSNAEVTMLLDSGVDLHSYQPTSEDMLKISKCDMFIYVGGESDEWVEGALEDAENEDMVVINLMDVLGDNVREEEVVEGMEHEHEHEHEAEGAESEEEEHEYDEHVWLSLRNAEILCDAIEEGIATVDPDHASVYASNLKTYKKQLAALDKSYTEAVSDAPVKTLLFGDRFPFRYLTDDYKLEYYAAFVGCSAETEASFETIRFLADKVDELGLSHVMTIEGSDQKIAKTIVKNTKAQDQKILTMNSMQSVTAKDVKAGASYLSIMEDNLTVLKDALK